MSASDHSTISSIYKKNNTSTSNACHVMSSGTPASGTLEKVLLNFTA